MNSKEVRKLWVEALRSGEYKQGKYNLHKKDEFCCLGVLCELAVKEGVTNVTKSGVDFLYEGHSISLPNSVVSWSGLRDRCGQFGKTSLMALNDYMEKGRSFSEIADVIESEPEGLFND